MVFPSFGIKIPVFPISTFCTSTNGLQGPQTPMSFLICPASFISLGISSWFLDSPCLKSQHSNSPHTLASWVSACPGMHLSVDCHAWSWAHWVWPRPLLSWTCLLSYSAGSEVGGLDRGICLGCEVIPHLLASRDDPELSEATMCPIVSGDLQVYIFLMRCRCSTKSGCVVFVVDSMRSSYQGMGPLGP